MGIFLFKGFKAQAFKKPCHKKIPKTLSSFEHVNAYVVGNTWFIFSYPCDVLPMFFNLLFKDFISFQTRKKFHQHFLTFLVREQPHQFEKSFK
jgi:hypothetical protein